MLLVKIELIRDGKVVMQRIAGADRCVKVEPPTPTPICDPDTGQEIWGGTWEPHLGNGKVPHSKMRSEEELFDMLLTLSHACRKAPGNASPEVIALMAAHIGMLAWVLGEHTHPAYKSCARLMSNIQRELRQDKAERN